MAVDRRPEPLHGDRDVSVPVCSVDAYRGQTWVPVPGYSHHLRPHGWVYLRHRGRLEARVRARCVRWQPVRPRHTATTPEDPGFGPGSVLMVDPDTFEEVAVDLGALAPRQRSGLRYLRVRRTGDVVHLLADAVLPGDDWSD